MQTVSSSSVVSRPCAGLDVQRAASRTSRRVAITGRDANAVRRPRAAAKSSQQRGSLRYKTAETSYIVSAEEDTSAGGEAFCWTKQWYPVAPLSTLDPSRPLATELLGQRLVLWCDANGEWQCFEDKCPHRLAPLSEGRLEGGNLQCAYHGWEFNGDGSCARIPQADDPKADATARASSRSCAVRHPAQVRHGLVFVWGEGGAVAAVEAAGTPLACAVPELDHPEHGDKYTFISSWYTGTVPYSYDTLVENVVDPSHVPFSHHGVQGRREKAGPDHMRMRGDVSLEGGFVVETGMKDLAEESEESGAAQMEQTMSFQPPSLVQYRRGGTSPEGVTKFNMAVYAVPVRPGTSRIFFAVFTSMRSPIFKLLVLKPTFLDHITRMEVLSGDNVFLHAQERELRRTAPASTYAQQFFMPATCDTGVTAFRRWYHSMAGETPYAPGTPAELPPLVEDRRVLLNRWSQHSATCPSCRSAHRGLGVLQAAAASLAAGLFLALAASLGAGAGVGSVSLLGGAITVATSTFRNALLGGGIALCLLATMKARALQQHLVFVDYVHAEKE